MKKYPSFSFYTKISYFNICYNKNNQIIKISLDTKSSIIPEKFKKIVDQVKAHMEGIKPRYDMNICDTSNLTVLQKKVYDLTYKVPFAKITTYKDIAIQLSSKKYARVIGNALRINPFIIIIPCHRVIRSNGELGGYIGNCTKIKEKILKIEKCFI